MSSQHRPKYTDSDLKETSTYLYKQVRLGHTENLFDIDLFKTSWMSVNHIK